MLSFTLKVYSGNVGFFNDCFEDSTLRVDFVMTNMGPDVVVAPIQVVKSPGWWGRRVNLSSLPVDGNARVIVRNKADGKTTYTNSFSTLFQEWLALPEADSVSLSMEGVTLVPLPQEESLIEISLFNNRKEKIATTSLVYSPKDINVRVKGATAKYDNRQIHSGDSQEKINVAILAEGYDATEKDTFYVHAAEAVKNILSHEPFAEHEDDFDFVAVFTPSSDSGMSVPQKGQWKDTSFSSHYNTFDSPRYLTTMELRKVHDALEGIPYAHIIILANDDTYGGGGIYNFYTLTTSRNPLFAPVVVHEFGHSFGALADEYFYDDDEFENTYPLDVEPWEKNITTLRDFENKWKSLLGTASDAGVVGIYEGGGYKSKGVFRPVESECRMKHNGAKGFCPVCIKAIEEMIEFNVRESSINTNSPVR